MTKEQNKYQINYRFLPTKQKLHVVISAKNEQEALDLFYASKTCFISCIKLLNVTKINKLT